MTDGQRIFIEQWRSHYYGDCDQDATRAVACAYDYMTENHMMNEPTMIYEAMQWILATNGSSIDELCSKDPRFVIIVDKARQDIADKEEKHQLIMQQAQITDTVADITKSMKILNEIVVGNDPSDPCFGVGISQAKYQLGRIQKAINELSDATAIDKRERTGQELFDRLKTVPPGYRCGVFGYRFPVETLSFIGARTSRGKTAAMSSIAIDAVFPANAEDKRKALFITFEESDWQIARRFALCKAWRDADEATRNELLNVVNPYYRAGDDEQDRNDPKQAFNAWMRGDLRPDTPVNSAFIAAVSKAKDEIIAAIQRGDISIYEGAGASTLDLRARLAKLEEGTVLLYDYIQLSPAEGGITDSYSKKTAVADADTMIINAMKTHRCVAIAGAQFNRQGTDKETAAEAEGIATKVDVFSESSFADCGNVEQDAHIAIGIGWIKADNGEIIGRYCELLKNREGSGVGSRKQLDVNGMGYSYLKAEGKVTWTISDKPPKDPKDNSSRKAADKPKTTRRRDVPKDIPSSDWEEEEGLHD